MDLEIVGRHALLFDDDATAEVVNSGGSLVPWAATGATDLLLDRHDVRHLLDRVPPRPRRSYSAALRSAPSPDGVSEADLDRERYLDLPADDGGDGTREADPSGDEEGTRQAGYNAIPFSYGNTADSDDPNSSNSSYRPSFYVPESLLNKLPPSEKVHQIIARTALFVSRHGGQSEIVLRVKQGSNPTFGFLMPDHRLHSYYRYLVDHPELIKDGADSEDADKDNKMVNSETEHAPSGGALSLLGTVYDSGDEDEGTVPASSKVTDPENGATTLVQGHGNHSSIAPDDKESRKDQTVAAESAGKPILMKKNPALIGNSIVAAQREKAQDTIAQSQNTKSGLSETNEIILEPPSFLKRAMEEVVEFILRNGKEFEQKLIDQDRTTGRYPFLLSSNPFHPYYLKMLQETQENTKSGLSETKEMILEPPSFLKRAMEKIVEFILRNGKEFEQKLIDQDRTTGRFPFLLSSNPYHSYYLKMLQETQESKSRGRSPENKDRRNSAKRKDRSPSERRDRRSSSERKDISHGKERSRSMERSTTGIDARIFNRSSAEPSEKQPHDQKGRGKFEVVVGVKKEPPRKVTADEAAAIVMAATRGLGTANDSRNTIKETRDGVHNLVSNDHSSSFGSFSSLQDRGAPSKHTSNSEADTSLTSSGQLTKEGNGIVDDDWIASTIAKAAAVAASKEADSSEATMTKEQKLKAERLRRAKMFAAIIKSGGSKMNDLATVGDPTNESAKPIHSEDMNVSTPDLPPAVKEREGSSVPFEREGSVAVKEEKNTDDERSRMRKYRKKHCPESDEDKNDSEESYKPSRKRHRSEHSRGHSKDVHKHKHRSKDGESRHHGHHHSSSEDEREHRSSKSRHRHRGHDRYFDDDDDGHRRSRRHRRDHRSSSKRNYEDDRYQIEESESEEPPTATAQPSDGAAEVPNELRAKIRAMLLETL